MSATLMIYMFFLMILVAEAGVDFTETSNFFFAVPINSKGELYSHRYLLSTFLVKHSSRVLPIDKAITAGVFIAKAAIPLAFIAVPVFDSGIVESVGAMLTSGLIMAVALYALALSEDL